MTDEFGYGSMDTLSQVFQVTELQFLDWQSFGLAPLPDYP